MTSATRIFYNGTILTMDEFGTEAEALAIIGDRIALVGTHAQVTALASSQTERTDLKGLTLLPGFIDGHGHFMETGRSLGFKVDLRSPPIGTIKNLDDLAAAIKARVEATPKGKWIEGFGYDDTLLEEKRHPLAQDIDRVAPDHPVTLSHVSGHFLAANSYAMKTAGLNAQTPDPPGGRLRRLPDSSPSGLFEEPSAIDLVEKYLPTYGPDQERKAVVTASQVWAAKGVTTAQDGWTSELNLQSLLAAEGFQAPPANLPAAEATLSPAASLLKVRVQILPSHGAVDSMGLPLASGTPITEKIVLGPVKLFADGSLQGYTGYLSNPYHKAMYGLGPRWRGYPMFDPDKLAGAVLKHHLAGRQIAIHGNGDQAIEHIIQAFEAALKVRPVSDHRHFVIHCQTVREDQLDRISRLGLGASFFVVHLHHWGDRHADIFLGPDRAARLNPLLSALERSIVFSLHNDSPVTPVDPLRSVQTAVLRLSGSGRPLGPEYAITAYQGLRAVTASAAHLAFEGHRKGRLAKGLLADLTVLRHNPLAVQPEKIAEIETLETIVGGQTVYGGL